VLDELVDGVAVAVGAFLVLAAVAERAAGKGAVLVEVR
jgi:hypothetical protein